MADLNQRQENFLKALLETPTVDGACKIAGINRGTGYKYLNDPVFMNEYRKIRRDAMQQVTARLQKASTDAVEVLQEIMKDSEKSPNARVQAAKNVLEIAYRSLEIDDLQERLEEVENKVEDSDNA